MLPLPNRNLALRELNTMDAAWMAVMHSHCFAAPQCWDETAFFTLLAQHQNKGFVLTVNDNPTGFILGSHIVDEGEILTLAVHPEHRRHGYGTLLVNTFIQERIKHNLQKCFLDVMETNSGAIEMYKSIGFEIIAKRPDYYQTADNQKKIDALVMRAQIHPLQPAYKLN